MKHAVYGIVQDQSTAERVVDGLRSAGFTGNDISVLFPDKGGTKDFAHEKSTKAPEGATTGGVAGMGIGARLDGWLELARSQSPVWDRLLPRARSWPRWVELQSAALPEAWSVLWLASVFPNTKRNSMKAGSAAAMCWCLCTQPTANSKIAPKRS